MALVQRIAFVLAVLIFVGTLAYLGLVYYVVATVPGHRFGDGSMQVVNCEEPRDKDAAEACPVLYCSKAIYESGRIFGEYHLRRVQDRRAGEGAPIMLGGTIDYVNEDGVHPWSHYLCRMRGDRVLSFDLLIAEEWSKMIASDEAWEWK